MKTVKQMLRQPIKTVTALVLMTLAAAIICICVGQALAARRTAKMLDYQFTSVALPIPKVEYDDLKIRVTNVALPDEMKTWLEETMRTNSDVVKELSSHGILSAYIPELTPLNYTQGPYIADNFSSTKPFWHFQPEPDGLPYSCAMLVIVLDEISEPEVHTESFLLGKPKSMYDFPSVPDYFEWYEDQEKETLTTGYTLNLTGTVTEVVSLQEGYRDPTGMIARLTLTVPDLEDLEALELIPGQRYLVYGMDYYEEDWALRGYLADERHTNPVKIDAFDLSKLIMLTEEELKYYENLSPSLRPVARYETLSLTQFRYNQVNAISMTLNSPVPLLLYDAVRDDAGNLLKVNPVNEIVYTDRYGETVTLSTDAYSSRYQIPTIAHLDGGVTDFIESEQGALWRSALERDEINNHAFAVIGVDKMGYLADFARGNSRITEGRDFTPEELTDGARVCIINESLAASSGLTVGDTINLNIYQGDPGLPYQEFRTENRGILTPSADFYFETITFDESAAYTIVGLYRAQTLWVDVSENEYGASPNTVFVPKSSVETPMEYPDSIFFLTPVIYNGKLEEFQMLASAAGYSEYFATYDQGYSEISGNFHNYEGLAQGVLAVGLAIYVVLLLLFMLLYPRVQTNNTKTMESLGVPWVKRFWHVMVSMSLITLTASMLGGMLGMTMWDHAVKALQTTAEATLSLQIGEGTLAAITLAQMFLVLILNTLVSLGLCAPKGLSNRRSL